MCVKPFNPIIVIPCYNHGSTLAAELDALAALELPCVIVDDGSNLETAQEINRLSEVYDWVSAVHRDKNGGKGAAVMTGLRWALEHGYTHALQIDADGQHDIADAKKLLAMSEETPEALISGQPVYDETVPKGRLIGRYFTHVWVWIETLSFEIKDSLCGFRVYPLADTCEIIRRARPGKRMDFDPEIMVRLFWQGVDVRFLPTRVIYPENGISHFRMGKDNLLLSLMHTRLVLVSPLYWPARLLRLTRNLRRGGVRR